MLVGPTAAAGTRNVPNLINPTSASSGRNDRAHGSLTDSQSTASPPKSRVTSNATQSSTTSPVSEVSAGLNSISLDSAPPPANNHDSGIDLSPHHVGSQSNVVTQGLSQLEGREMIVSDASEPPSLEGIVNLQNTNATTVHTRQEPGKMKLSA